MSWLQKRPQFENTASFSFQINLNNRTILMVGLGNYPKKYQGTRHNIGFEALDYLVDSLDEFGNWNLKKDLKSLVSTGQISDKKVIAIKPLTLMNNSGQAVQEAIDFYRIKISDMIVIHDDLDINFGQIRIRTNGNSAGHNGLKSIVKYLKTSEFKRIKIGIKNPDLASIDAKDFVLQKFNSDEKKHIKTLKKEVSSFLSEYLIGDTDISNETRSFIF